MKGWTREHDDIVAEYIEHNREQTPKQMTVALFNQMDRRFDIDYVLKQVMYWRNYF